MSGIRSIQKDEVVEYRPANELVAPFRSLTWNDLPVWIPDGSKVYLAKDSTVYTFYANRREGISPAQAVFLDELLEGDQLCVAS